MQGGRCGAKANRSPQPPNASRAAPLPRAHFQSVAAAPGALLLAWFSDAVTASRFSHRRGFAAARILESNLPARPSWRASSPPRRTAPTPGLWRRPPSPSARTVTWTLRIMPTRCRSFRLIVKVSIRPAVATATAAQRGLFYGVQMGTISKSRDSSNRTLDRAEVVRHRVHVLTGCFPLKF